ncbi:hypothetical protein TBLA_0C05120 [Henningerozyma blattae CBS 6284]|uniref:Uncharacterized protein n=1 Tax=Henningerozyma blattae (strain ATCC 34711 / CBS 6284 / DSM 70876 / NBRC 10599 / NRRL Y-10934 / UCD 77-7) TaxID=1071380 RepID=I2H1Q6_HENB6|nr:hypothetical protein TBLA_0C05120 [Tetrapisispora blattae CBS 6284]CCH60308.1 hypothetical protein TBLA_0C05120 [Tetrapisispora blattae CBS 6284]
MMSVSRYYDIAVNLTDPMFRGIYRGKQRHSNDMQNVLKRCSLVNIKQILVTGSSIVETKEAIDICKTYGSLELPLYYTIGVHPCCVNEFGRNLHEDETLRVTIDSPSNNEDYNSKVYIDAINDTKFSHEKLKELYKLMEARIQLDPKNFRAIGEFGLDYDRLNYSSQEMQRVFFEEQLKLVCILHENSKLQKPIPLFLHMRSACSDFIDILKRFLNGFIDEKDSFQLKSLIKAQENESNKLNFQYKLPPDMKFVVHSFTDTKENLKKLLNLSKNCYIGLNGASLRDETNIESAKELPINRMLIETDAPWCDIRKTHQSYPYLLNSGYKSPFTMVKKEKFDKILDSDEKKELTMIKERNEPCSIVQVAHVLSDLKNIPVEELAESVYKTSCEVYGE